MVLNEVAVIMCRRLTVTDRIKLWLFQSLIHRTEISKTKCVWFERQFVIVVSHYYPVNHNGTDFVQ